jgi:hypothetical protein
MANEIARIFGKLRHFVLAAVSSIDYSASDYVDDRMRGLEHEVELLREKLNQTTPTPQPKL